MFRGIIGFVPILFLLLVTGCASYVYQPVNSSNYAAFRKSHDLTIGWRINSGESFTEIEGYVLNNSRFIMQDLELWVTLLDSSGLEKERKSYFVIPTRLGVESSSGFQLEFSNHVKQGDRIRFLYRYKGGEGQDEIEVWMNSFEETL